MNHSHQLYTGLYYVLWCVRDGCCRHVFHLNSQQMAIKRKDQNDLGKHVIYHPIRDGSRNIQQGVVQQPLESTP